MKKTKLNNTVKIIGIVIGSLLAIPAIFIAYFAISFFMAKHNQVTQAEADKVCQEFFEEVKSDITAVPGYKVTSGNKDCRPDKDEAGFTDYYFDVTFRVAKPGSDSIDGIKANINYLAAKYPNKKYPVWVDNVPAEDGQPGTICVNASKQIQENGEIYQSSPPEHYPRYTKPGSIEGFAPCANLWTAFKLVKGGVIDDQAQTVVYRRKQITTLTQAKYLAQVSKSEPTLVDREKRGRFSTGVILW